MHSIPRFSSLPETFQIPTDKGMQLDETAKQNLHDLQSQGESELRTALCNSR
jgi:hypothetical protein